MKTKPSRYRYVAEEIIATRAAVLVEVGTWNGDRAIEMARAAASRSASVSYFGFDLFEAMTPEKSKEEFNVKTPWTRSAVQTKLLLWANKNRVNASFNLHQGDTTKILPWFVGLVGANYADFAWVDGGHSVETIESDWTACEQIVRPGKSILLDDFYSDVPDEEAFLEKYGANRLVARLTAAGYAVEILPEKDPVNGGGFVQIVRVRL